MQGYWTRKKLPPYVEGSCVRNRSPTVCKKLGSRLRAVLYRHARNCHVTPLLKKGGRSSTSNYKPVSLQSTVCKVLEKFIRRST